MSYYAKLVKALIVFCGLRDRHHSDKNKGKLVPKSIESGVVCILVQLAAKGKYKPEIDSALNNLTKEELITLIHGLKATAK